MCFLSLSAFDLVNIHLFHDASNLVAWEKSPSVYSGTRQKALGFVLDRSDNLLKACSLSINACRTCQALVNYSSEIMFFHSRLRFLSNERPERFITPSFTLIYCLKRPFLLFTLRIFSSCIYIHLINTSSQH